MPISSRSYPQDPIELDVGVWKMGPYCTEGPVQGITTGQKTAGSATERGQIQCVTDYIRVCNQGQGCTLKGSLQRFAI